MEGEHLAAHPAVHSAGCTHDAVGTCSNAGTETPGAAEVRLARTRFNSAIAARDTAAIRALHLPSYHLVNGRSVQTHGSDAVMGQWERAFKDPTVQYIRTTRSVITNEDWGLAQELGDWTGHTTNADGVAESSGVYVAKWQRTASGQWLLQAEVLTTLRCTGSIIGCPGPLNPG